MDELTEWLRQQLDEDERIARGTGQPSTSWQNVDMDGELRDDMNAGTVAYVPREETRAHIARHDPARVLREIEAKRQVLADHPIVPETYPRATVGGQEVGGPYFPFGCENCHAEHDTGEVHGFGYCLIWKALALPYADRPGYREEWRP